MDFTTSLWYDADKPRGDMQLPKKHETRSERRGFGVGRSKLDGADAREAEQHGFDSSEPDGADAREAERHGFGSNEANGAGI